MGNKVDDRARATGHMGMRVIMKHLYKFFIFVLCFSAVCMPWGLTENVVFATPEYSYQTDKACAYCHEDVNGGGTLTHQGE